MDPQIPAEASTPVGPSAGPPIYNPEYMSSNRGLATGLAGTTVAVLTFAMFFMYDRVQSGAFDSVLFQLTIADLLAGTFLFGYSGTCFFWLMAADLTHDARARRYLLSGDVCFVLGLACLMIGPALIMFTARLPVLGGFALVLWIGLILFVFRGGRRSR